MIILWILAGACLVGAAAATLYRLVAGPAALDRLVAAETIVAVCLSALGAWAAYSRESTVLAALTALALLGFIGSIAVPRFRTRGRAWVRENE